MNQTRVSAEQLLTTTFEAHRPLAEAVGIALRLAVAVPLPELLADRDRLLQVFENLLGNALKFTPPGGQITLGAAPRDGEVLFWINDSGIGIAAEDLPHLFERFWQARKPERDGAGLGLPIAKGLVRGPPRSHLGGEHAGPGEYLPFYDSDRAAPRRRPRRFGPAQLLKRRRLVQGRRAACYILHIVASRSMQVPLVPLVTTQRAG